MVFPPKNYYCYKVVEVVVLGILRETFTKYARISKKLYAKTDFPLL
jgi:hypothetical protein